MHMKHLKKLCNSYFVCMGAALPRPHDRRITLRAQHTAPILALILLASSIFADTPLTDAQKQWVDAVHWIISDYEQNAFLKLKDAAERDRFIQAFWVDRDPTPGTARNEFREEHYRRFEYANKEFGHESDLPGWQTDRGRIYILLGKPRFITRNPASFEMQPLEFWMYTGDLGYGLPSSIYLLFYQKSGVGPYRLYSPLNDGIQSLFKPQPSFFLKTDEQLYDYLESHIDKQIAAAALSYLPSDGGRLENDGTITGSVSTEVLLGNLANARNYDVAKRKYVQDIVNDRPTVKTYYSLGTEGIHDAVYWLQGRNGLFYLNYAIEFDPDKLQMGQYNDEYYTSFNVDGQITTPEKTVVDQISGNHEIRLDRNQFAKAATLPFQFQGIRPLASGKYGVTIVLANNVSGQSATFTEELEIPDPAALKTPYFSPLLPVRSTESIPHDQKLRPFQVADKVLIPNITARFSTQQPIEIYHQIIFPTNFSAQNLQLHYAVKNGDKVEAESSSEVKQSDLAGSSIDILKQIGLSNLLPGKKELTVELLENGKLISKAPPLSFELRSEPVTGSWKFSAGIPAYDASYHVLVVSQQLMRLKHPQEAASLLNEALKRDPKLTDVRIQLMQTELRQKNYAHVLQLGQPAEVNDPRNQKLLWFMGWASYGMEKYDDSIRYFERLRIEKPDAVDVLNVLADAYFRLNQRDKSLERVQQSLALKPNQGDILQLKAKLEK
jgi:GWxTD domain-containing protein